MRLRGQRGALAAVVAAVLAIVGARLVRTPPPDIATVEVRRGTFLREVGADGTFKAVKATPLTVPVQSGREQKIAVMARDGTWLKAGDLVVQFDAWDAEREAADGRADLAAARARLEKAAAEGGKNARSLGLDLDVAEEALARAKTFELTDEQLFSRHAVIESSLDRRLFSTRADVAGRKLSSTARLSSAERALGEIEAAKARTKVDNAAQSLRALRIVAPHDGLLLLERKWTGEPLFVGDSVWPGQKVAEIPDLSRLEARVLVLETDAAGLRPGLAARVSIEGRPGPDLGATVTHVDAVAKPRGRQSPVRYFETVLSLNRTEVSFMKPGQRVRSVIRLEEAAGAIAVPRGALFDRDGRRVVYRWRRGAFEPVEVTVGGSSVSRVVVDKGLQEGDRIALRDPTRARAGGEAGSPARPPGEAP